MHVKFGHIIIEVKLGNKFIVKCEKFVYSWCVCVSMYTLACALISESNLSQILTSSHLFRRIFGGNVVSFSSPMLFIVSWLNNKRSN